MTQIDPSQHGIHTLEELGAAEGAHILIAGEDGQGELNVMHRSLFHAVQVGTGWQRMDIPHPPTRVFCHTIFVEKFYQKYCCSMFYALQVMQLNLNVSILMWDSNSGP